MWNKSTPLHWPREQSFLDQRSQKTGRIVCLCGKGYGSEFDGICTGCRKGVTAFEAKETEKSKTTGAQQ